jgi:hypothetical protein
MYIESIFKVYSSSEEKERKQKNTCGEATGIFCRRKSK